MSPSPSSTEPLSAVIARAVAQVESGRPREALAILDRAIELLSDDAERAVVHGYLGRIRLELGEHTAALAHHERAAAIHGRLGRDAYEAAALADLAGTSAALGQVEKALEYHEREIAIHERTGDRHSRALALVRVARLGSLAGEPEQARQLLLETIPTFGELGDRDGLGSALWALGKVELMLERDQDAFDHLTDSYKLNLALDRLDGICFVGVDLGQLLFAAGQLDEGRQVLARSRDGFVRLGLPDLAQKTQDVIDALEADAAGD